jgi:hypothetical protein
MHVTKRGQFKVNNRHISSVFGDGFPQFIHIAGQVHHPEMVIQRFCQHFRGPAVTLSDNYTEWFHEILPLGLGAETTVASAYRCMLRSPAG